MSAADHDRPGVPASDAAGEAATAEWAELLVAQARADGAGAHRRERPVDRAGAPSAPGPAWRAGTAEHLGYERHAVEGTGSPNSRNGFTPKRVTTEIGEGRPRGAPGPCGHVRACDGGASTGAVWTACRAT